MNSDQFLFWLPTLNWFTKHKEGWEYKFQKEWCVRCIFSIPNSIAPQDMLNQLWSVNS